MKTNKITTAAVAAIALLTACQDTMFSDVAQLSLSKRRLYTTTQSLSFEASGNLTATLNVEAENAPWKIEGFPGWISSVTETSGSGSASIVFTAKENLSPDEALAGSVRLFSTSGDFAYEKTLPIVQQQAPVRLNPSETSHSFTTGSAASCDISVDANIDWTASCDKNWVSLSCSADNLTVSVAENTDNSGRSASVLLMRAGSSDAITQINITQPKARIEGIEESITFQPDGGSQGISFSAETAWSAEIDANGTGWLSITDEPSGSAGPHTITLKAEPNISRVAQSSYLYINIGNHREITVSVQQDAASISLSPVRLNYEADGGSLGIKVSSNFRCSASSDAEWCKVNANGIIGTEQPVNIEVESHQSTISRSANVSVGSGCVAENVEINQAGRYFNDFSDSDSEIEFPAKGGEHTVTVDTDGECTVEAKPDGYYDSKWLSALSTTQKNEFVIKAERNQDKEARSGRVIVSVSEKSDTILVTQKGAEIYLEYDKEFMFDADGSNSLNITPTTNNAVWTLFPQSSSSFLTVTRVDAAGYMPYLEIKASPNPSINERRDSVKVNVESTDNVTLTAVLSQLGRRIRFKDQSEWQLTGKGGEKDFIIEKNGDFSFSASDSWIHITALENVSNTINVKVDPISNTNMSREGYVIVALEGLPDSDASADNSLKSDTLFISQNKRSIAVTGGSSLSDSHAATLEFDVATDDTGWNLTANGENTGLEYKGGWYVIAITDNHCTVKIDENRDTASREVNLVFKCNNDDVSQSITITQPGRKLNIDTSTINMGYEGGSVERSIDSDTDFTTSISDDDAANWLTVNVADGIATFSCDRNMSLNDRSATVTFTATNVDETLSRSIVVNQDGVTFSVVPIGESSVPNLGGQVKFEVTTEDSQQWTVTTALSGVSFAVESGTFSGSQGTGNGVVIATIPANASKDDRTIDIVFNSSLTGDVTLPISQEGEKVAIEASATGFSSQSAQFTVNVTSNTNWTVLSKPSWIKLSSSTGTGNGSVTASIEDNPSTSPREGGISFKASASAAESQEVTISQAARYLRLIDNSGNDVPGILAFNNNGESYNGISEITIDTDGSWESVPTYSYSTAENWINFTTSGNVLTLKPGQITGVEHREGDLTVRLTDLEDGTVLERKIHIIQGNDIDLGDYDPDEDWN